MTIFVARIRHLLGQFSNSWGTPQGLDTLARVLSVTNHINCLCHSWIMVWVSWGYHPHSVLVGFCLLALTWFPSPPISLFSYPHPPPGQTHLKFFCFIFIHRLHQDEPIVIFVVLFLSTASTRTNPFYLFFFIFM